MGLNHSFSLLLILLALTGMVLWYRRIRSRGTYPKPSPLLPAKVFRTAHHGGGLLSWLLLFLFPLTGMILLHHGDFSVLLNQGLPTRWLPSQFDQNRWRGPVRLHLHTLVISRSHAARLWVGHAYGLFASDDGGQRWRNVGAALQPAVRKQIEHLFVGPWWFEFLYAGNA